jgi:hypothetical protein
MGVRLALEPGRNPSPYGKNPLVSQVVRFRETFFILLRVENDLGFTSPVPEINENEVAQVSSPVHPTHKDSLVPDMLDPQAAAIMGPLPISDRINLHRQPLVFL